jgi:hypothetical protein
MAWNTPMAINNDGMVVGFANSPQAVGDAFDYRPFVWTATGGFRALPVHPATCGARHSASTPTV